MGVGSFEDMVLKRLNDLETAFETLRAQDRYGSNIYRPRDENSVYTCGSGIDLVGFKTYQLANNDLNAFDAFGTFSGLIVAQEVSGITNNAIAVLLVGQQAVNIVYQNGTSFATASTAGKVSFEANLGTSGVDVRNRIGGTAHLLIWALRTCDVF